MLKQKRWPRGQSMLYFPPILYSPRNARKLLKFNSQLGFCDISWELGNEPNSLKHQLDFPLSGSQLGRDFKRLRKLLDSFQQCQTSRKNGSDLLVGPDVNQLRAQGPKSKVQKALKYLGKVVKASQRCEESRPLTTRLGKLNLKNF